MTKNGILKNVNHQLIVGTHYKVSNDVYRIESMAFAKLGIKKVTVPENVKEIGDKAFYNCSNLKEVDIQSNLIEQIPELCFFGCWSLESFIIPKSIKTISKEAFSTSGLCEINIPNNVVEIGEAAFSRCSKLKKVDIQSNSIEQISKQCFICCKSLKTFIIPESVAMIGEGAFSGSGLCDINIPNNVMEIREAAFRGCYNLNNVTISNNVKNIQPYTFAKCSSMKKIIIPDSVETIEKESFSDCELLKDVTLSKNLRYIGEGTFSHCISLKRLDIPNGIEIIDSLAFNSCHNLVSLVIPKSIKKIANWAFSYCENLDLTIETSLFHFDGNSFIDGNKRIENLTIYNHKINLDGNWNDEIRNVRIKELKDMIDTYLRNNNITDSRFYDFNTHRNFILFIVNNLESSIIKDYDYKDYFDKYMSELFGPKINSIQEIFPINIQQLINNNANENNNMPYHLYLYGKELNLTDKILEIKRRIDTYLKNNNITDKKYFSYTKHEGFIREMLDCIHNDPNYNYIYALNNYMKYITDISLKDETKETSKTSEVIKEDIQLSKDDEILKLKEEVEMLKQQLPSDGNNIYLKGK